MEAMSVVLSLGTGAVYIYFIFWLMSLMLGSNEAANASLKEMNNAKDRLSQRVRQNQLAEHEANMKALRGEDE